MIECQRVAILGGTGSEGGALALRFAHAGLEVLIGSRDIGRAAAKAQEINQAVGRPAAVAHSYRSAAEEAEIAVLTVPYAAQANIAEGLGAVLHGKILVDATVPLVPPRVGRVSLPQDGSAVERLQKLLSPQVRVVSAFQNVSAHHLADLKHSVECDVIVCGDDSQACDTVIALIAAIGMRGLYGGPACNSAAAEALTSVLITINRRYKTVGAGIRITGLPPCK